MTLNQGRCQVRHFGSESERSAAAARYRNKTAPKKNREALGGARAGLNVT